ncbi:ROK family protein [Cellulomonas citrea]|uniref:ROK family protein n=1 Tax=Cellulomonas citrea TaxID=1909423 RepID=UPI001357B481|nr:ROK family protein [Cellulomonas citrea]
MNEQTGASRKASVRDVRRTNRALLLRHVMFAGETTRPEAGAATMLSPGTITNLVTELIAEGTVVEGRKLDSPGGRPRTVLAVNPHAAVVFGADVGEAQVTVEAFDLAMRRLGGRTHAFTGRRISPQTVSSVVAGAVGALTTELVASGDFGATPTILGIGLGVPGIVEHPDVSAGDSEARDEPLVHAQVVGWDSVRFSELAAQLPAPLLIDNGAKTTTQAEAWYGSAQGVEHGAVVLIGDGVGAGIITNGRLYRGSSSSAGEWGHTKISLDGIRCRCGARGCVETFVGASAVLERWRGREDAWLGREPEGIDELFAAYHQGDEVAERSLRDLIHHLGIALSNLVNLYNPQKIVVGGWFGDRLAEEFLADIAAAVRRSSLSQPGAEVVVERSSLGRRATALGAATLPLDRFIERGWPQ